MKIEEHVSLKDLTTFKVGGRVRYVVTATPQEIPDAVTFAAEKGLPIIPLGGGSNILASDADLAAVMLRVDDLSIKGTDALMTAGAGARWDDVVQYAVDHEWWGIENLSAIPGTVGGAVFQNIGAYGAALSDTLTRVRAYDVVANEVVEFDTAQCAFGYRTSIFKTNLDRYIIFSATFALSSEPKPNTGYKDLRARFGTETPPLADVRTAVSEIRAQKFPPLDQYGTAGSFFLNPVMSAADAAALKAQFPDMPLFELPEGGVKVPIAWIMDHVLHTQGTRVGTAFVWPQQTLVLATEGPATAADVRAVAKLIAEKVFVATKIKISPEVRVIDAM